MMCVVQEPKKSAFSKIDLDESPGAPPISQQLGTALRQNSTRVMDLFRQVSGQLDP